MSSAPKKRPKSKSNPNPKSPSSIPFLPEPPDSLFPTKDEFLRLIALVAIAASVAFVFNFFYSALINPQSKPFCDGPEDSLYFISDDFCEPCPSHGRCHEGELECVLGYRRHGKLCVEDASIHETANKLAERVEFRLCNAYAELLCYETGIIWVEENVIWNDLDMHELVEDDDSGNAIYMYAKERAMETVNRMLESRTNSQGVKELKCPDILAEQYKPSSCRIRQWIFELALLVLPVCAALLGLAFVFWKFHQRQFLSNRVDKLYQEICEELEEKALKNRTNDECEPWVVASLLRDSFLSLKERKNPVLWKKVEELVQEDSRVDCYRKLVKGEYKLVWEWQVEGSLSSSRSKKRGEAIKLKSSKGTERSHAHLYSLKPEPIESDTMML